MRSANGFVSGFSNYPPGVTGNEPEITGEYADDSSDCPNCGPTPNPICDVCGSCIGCCECGVEWDIIGSESY